MGRMGFQIGQMVNKAARFAVAAGGDKLNIGGTGGTGGELLKAGQNLITGGQGAQAGASLSDRLKAGFSAVSPEFAQAQNLQSQIQTRGTQNQINKGILEQQRMAQEDVNINDIMPGLSEQGKKLALADLRESGLVRKDAQGNEFIKRGAMEKEMSAFNADPVRQQRLIQTEIDNTTQEMEKMSLRATGLLDKEAEKMSKDAGLDWKTMSEESKAEAKAKVMKGFEAGSIVNPEATTLQAEVQKMFGKREQWQDRMDALEEAQTTPLQRAQIGKLEAEKLAAEAEAAGISPAEMKQVWKMRQDFEKQEGVSQYRQVTTMNDKMDFLMERSARGDEKSRGATDQSIIILFNKMLDPESVVRESEYARTPEGMATLDRLHGKYKKIAEGGVGITDDERKEIVEVAKAMQKANNAWAVREAESTIEFAGAFGIDPSLIVGRKLVGKVGEKKQRMKSADDFYEQATTTPPAEEPFVEDPGFGVIREEQAALNAPEEADMGAGLPGMNTTDPTSADFVDPNQFRMGAGAQLSGGV